MNTENRVSMMLKLSPLSCATFAALVLLSSTAPAVRAGDIPDHPSGLTYPDRVFDPPNREAHRRVLNNGVVLYIAEDHDFPLVDVSVVIGAGDWLDPEGKTGLAGLAGGQMRSGGSGGLTAEEFDEEADFLAATISCGLGATEGGASAGCLSKDLDRVLELFFGMLKEPAFQADRLELAKAQAFESMKERNDSTTSIEAREWGRLLRGDHYTALQSTKPGIESITRDDLAAFHSKYIHPGNFVIAASGDFNADELARKLEKHMEGWKIPKIAQPPIPDSTYKPEPGLYTVHKADVNQGRVRIGHVGPRRDAPDYHAALVMNDILGGGGFTSRIMSRVRSDEGLAYSAGSAMIFGVWFDGVWRAGFQSRSKSCAQAADIVLKEIDRIRTEEVNEDELRTSVNSLIESFPHRFSSPRSTVRTFADDEYSGQDPKFWEEYRKKLEAVTAADVLAAAKKYLHPDQRVMLSVGNIDDIMAGDPDRPDYDLLKLSPTGKAVKIPLPDPLTLVYPEE